MRNWGPPDTTEEALLEAIFAHPAEDTPRLVYADWLDEHERGHQAAFIRAQIATYGQESYLDLCLMGGVEYVHYELGPCPVEGTWLTRMPPSWVEDMCREEVWWYMKDPTCAAAGVRLENTAYTEVVWRRGFVDQLTCGLKSFLAVYRRHRLPLSRVRLRMPSITAYRDQGPTPDTVRVMVHNGTQKYLHLQATVPLAQYHDRELHAKHGNYTRWVLAQVLEQNFPSIQFIILRS